MPDQEIQKDRWPDGTNDPKKLSVCVPVTVADFRGGLVERDPFDGAEVGWKHIVHIPVVPLSELEAEKEHSRRGDEEIRKLEAALGRTEDLAAEKGDALVEMTLHAGDLEKRAEVAEKALKEAEHAVRALLTERRRVGTGPSSVYLPDNPVTRERLNDLAALLASNDKENPNG